MPIMNKKATYLDVISKSLTSLLIGNRDFKLSHVVEDTLKAIDSKIEDEIYGRTPTAKIYEKLWSRVGHLPEEPVILYRGIRIRSNEKTLSDIVLGGVHRLKNLFIYQEARTGRKLDGLIEWKCSDSSYQVSINLDNHTCLVTHPNTDAKVHIPSLYNLNGLVELPLHNETYPVTMVDSWFDDNIVKVILHSLFGNDKYWGETLDSVTGIISDYIESTKIDPVKLALYKAITCKFTNINFDIDAHFARGVRLQFQNNKKVMKITPKGQREEVCNVTLDVREVPNTDVAYNSLIWKHNFLLIEDIHNNIDVIFDDLLKEKAFMTKDDESFFYDGVDYTMEVKERYFNK